MSNPNGKKLECTFTTERPTKNTVRFTEEGNPPVVGTLYIQKWAVETLGNPSRVKVTIEAQ